MNERALEHEKTRETVRKAYGRIAETAESCCEPKGGCCGPAASTAEGLVRNIGYGEAELASVPEGANLGLSCGNPTALASLRPGETVLDLGAGGGFDVFIAAEKVGPSGRAIGVDMTPEMLGRASRNAEAFTRRTGLRNVEFRLGEIEHLPVADASVDAVISNCVLNLSPEKEQVWREIARVLRPGGRAAISDLALLRPLPEAIRGRVEALVGCVAGAALAEDVERMARAAGLTDVVLERKSDYVDAMVNLDDPLYRELAAHLPPGARAGDYVTSLSVSARKPA